MQSQKASTSASWTRSLPAVRPERAPGSRTIWDFRPAFRAQRSPVGRYLRHRSSGHSAQYRMPDVANLSRFLGRGVYYAATHLEATLCKAEDVVVVGGGNSAGQAAVFLAGSCRHVHMLVRCDGLAESMSRYLIRRIQDTPNITLHARTQLTALEGSGRLERVSWMPGNGEPVAPDFRHVLLRRWARDRSAYSSCIGCCANSPRPGISLRSSQLTGHAPRPRNASP